MSLERITYTDEEGRKKVVLLPNDSLEADPSMGVPVGPPTLENLNLPKEIEVRLNNELFNRNILTAQDALKHRGEILYAVQAALKIDANSVLDMYLGAGYQNAREAKAEIRAAEPRANVNRPRRNNRRRGPVKT